MLVSGLLLAGLGWLVVRALCEISPGAFGSWFLLVPVVLFGQMLVAALFYALHRKRPERAWLGQESVDVFVATCGEPLALIEGSVRAARDMRGAHATWLLDDAGDPRVAALARRLGVGYLTREDNEGKKAGALNAALAATTGELVCIFDVDHQPAPEFLERTAGYFEDPSIGFVQNALSFRNSSACWTARATNETSREYYGMVNCGKDAVGAATMMGSNAVIRRSALRQIGGYRSGLAEDLETSVALHAAGWRSAYVSEPLAPGLTPEDYVGFARQQQKWARGVFEAGLSACRSSMSKLTLAQRLGYLLRFSYYTAPAVTVVTMLTAGVALLFEVTWIEPTLRAMLPVVLMFLAVRALAFLCFVTPSMRGSTLRGGMLFAASWPAYCSALLQFLARREPVFTETPKDKRRTPKRVLWPQVALCAFLSTAVLAGFTWQEFPTLTVAALVWFVFCHSALVPSMVPGLRKRIRRFLLA